MLWKVNKPILCQNVLDELYHAALNLSLRVIHEQEQKKEVCKIWTFFPLLYLSLATLYVVFLLSNTPLEFISSFFVDGFLSSEPEGLS